MKKFCIAMMALLAFTTSASAQVSEPKDTPQLEFALQLKVTLGEAFTCGETQHGRRTVIPITGGTFEGPNIKGTIRLPIRLSIVLNWRLYIASRQMMVCISTFAIVVSSILIKMLMATLRSISRLLPSLRLLQIANMRG